jgi:hypothetical protein
MAGYSGTPLLKKLGIKDGDRVLVKNAPAAMPEELAAVPNGSRRQGSGRGAAFRNIDASIQCGICRASTAVKPDGTIWAAWPKKASGIETDLTENRDPRHRVEDALCRCEGLRHRRDVVGAEAGCQERIARDVRVDSRVGPIIGVTNRPSS